MATGIERSRGRNVCTVCRAEIIDGRSVCDTCARPYVEPVQSGSAEGATADHFGRHVTDEQVQRDGLLIHRPRIEYGAPVTRNQWPRRRRKK